MLTPEVFTKFIPKKVDLVIARHTFIPLFADDLNVLDIFADVALFFFALAKRIFIVYKVLGPVQNQTIMALYLILFGLTVNMTMRVHMSLRRG